MISRASYMLIVEASLTYVNHPYFPNQQLLCAPWVNAFHRNYSQNFFREHLRQHWNVTNLSFLTYVGAILVNNPCTHIPTPGEILLLSLNCLWDHSPARAPSLQSETTSLDGGFVPTPKGQCSVPRATSLFSDRLPRKGHDLRWTWEPLPFKAAFSEEMK